MFNSGGRIVEYHIVESCCFHIVKILKPSLTPNHPSVRSFISEQGNSPPDPCSHAHRPINNVKNALKTFEDVKFDDTTFSHF